jgi:hypothetical protein
MQVDVPEIALHLGILGPDIEWRREEYLMVAQKNESSDSACPWSRRDAIVEGQANLTYSDFSAMSGSEFG